MVQHKSMPRWAQWTAGSVLVGVAVAAGVTSLVINISHGLESGLATAVTFGLADVGKIVIPMVAVAIGWTMQIHWTLVACAVVSLFCASSYYLDRSGQALLGKQHEADVAADKAKRVSELEADLARANALADAESKNKGCRDKCAAFRQQAQNASQALVGAREARAASGVAETSGMAVLLASLTARNESTVARWLTGLKAGLSILLLECLVYLSIPGGQMIGMAMAKPSENLQTNSSEGFHSDTNSYPSAIELKAIGRQRDAKGRFLPRPAEVPVVSLTRIRERVS